MLSSACTSGRTAFAVKSRRVRSRRAPASVSCECRAPDAEERPSFSQRLGQCAAGVLSAAALTVGIAAGPQEVVTPSAEAVLISRDPVKNAKAILRYALPIDNKPIRKIQGALENISEEVRVPGNRAYGPILGAARKSASVLKTDKAKIIADFAPDKKAVGLANIDKLEAGLPQLIDVVATKDKNEILYKQQELLEYVGAIEESMVGAFPFEVPPEYSNLPQLKGRATLEMKIRLFGAAAEAREGTMIIVADGLNAPVSAGDFVDLAAKGFYDGMEIQRADGFIVQTGKPSKGEFYIDPATNKERTIPFEVKVVGDKEPIYEFTLEDLGRFNEQPILPFNAYGTMAMARGEFDNNSASSQVFFLLKESELTPSGSNLLDGRYAVFGYIVQGQDLLGEMKVGDKIEYLKVVAGKEYLVLPK
ncbi:hypothetical protein BSKO_13930 [Bryopsis sp. KO-2023]|nr:hypothetical protein BSKO_13930 [Bryopsis sp. KO-2023]